MFRFQNARGARTEDHRHAVGTVALPSLYGGLDESILLESEEREPIIPAIEPLQFRGGRTTADEYVFHIINPADVGGDSHIFEVAWPQPGTPIPQCLIGLVEAFPQR